MKLRKTPDHYHCTECHYEGPVNCYEVVDMEPYGDRHVEHVSYEDFHCPECGSYEVEET